MVNIETWELIARAHYRRDNVTAEGEKEREGK